MEVVHIVLKLNPTIVIIPSSNGWAILIFCNNQLPSLVLDQLSSQTSKSKNPSQWKCGNGLDGVGA